MYVIHKGVEVIVPIDAIHHNPDIYPEPEIFNPDRFLPEEIEKRHSMAYLPFGDGPRACIGLRFALLHAKIGMIALLNSLKFSPCQKTEKTIALEERNFFLTPKNGIHLQVELVQFLAVLDPPFSIDHAAPKISSSTILSYADSNLKWADVRVQLSKTYNSTGSIS
uniref:Cytochrome P450 n=1 Tax=Megaselia scalaris TaxID=36166 RepID=T1GRM9_MEGSC